MPGYENIEQTGSYRLKDDEEPGETKDTVTIVEEGKQEIKRSFGKIASLELGER